MTRGKLSKNTVLVWPFNSWCADKKYRGIKLNCSSSTAQSKAPSQLNFCGSKRSGSGDDFCLLRDSAFLVIVLPVWVAGSVSAHFQVVSLMCFLCCFFVVVYGFLFFVFLSLVTLVRQPSELVGVPFHQQENKCAAVGKTKSAAAVSSLQFSYPVFAMNTCSAGTAPAQVDNAFAAPPALLISSASNVHLWWNIVLKVCVEPSVTCSE